MEAFKKLEDEVGEIKRLYIRPEYRGRGFGTEMFKRLIDKGKEFEYSTLRLNSMDFMTTARHVYRSAGFEEIDEYPGSEILEWYRPHCVFTEKKIKTGIAIPRRLSTQT